MPARLSLVGQRFGKLTVLADAEPILLRGRKAPSRSLCLCDCGRQSTVCNYSLSSDNTRSCGCVKGRFVHGHARTTGLTRVYSAWRHMIQRCTKASVKQFHDYGGRGIKICPEWLNSFPRFLSDMGEGKKGWTLERVWNDGDYELTNCVWATHSHQNRNKRNNIVLTVRGKTGCLKDLCDDFNVPYNRALWRLHRGWELEHIFFVPKSKGGGGGYKTSPYGKLKL